MGDTRNPLETSTDRNELSIGDTSPLYNTPSEVVTFIVDSWLTRKEKVVMAKICKTYNRLFQPNLEKEAEPFVEEALHYAAFGKINELDELLKKYRGLIYKRGKTRDIRDRIVHGTPYRIALGAKDWSPFPDKFGEMTEMIESHMRKFPDGENEIILQKAEQFPQGWEEEERKREENDSLELKKVFAAIGQSEKDEDCTQAIEQFIDYLKSQNEIKTGYHFNDKLLSEAHALYEKHHKQFGGSDSRKNRLAAIKIKGAVLDRLTACLAMAHRDGLGSIANGDQPLSRSLDIEGIPFFSPGLGKDHFICSFYKSRRGVFAGWQSYGAKRINYGMYPSGGSCAQPATFFISYTEKKRQTSPIDGTPSLSVSNHS